MKFSNILEEIEKVDGEIYERISPRRKAMQDFYKMGSKVALASMPLAIGSMFSKAYGQTVPAAVINVLQFALTLEHFEARFYKDAAAVANLIPAADVPALTIIAGSEAKHVAFLQDVITKAGAKPVDAKPSYDFTGSGAFPTVLTDYKITLAVAQVLEDTGVRAYKGRAGELLGQKVYLTAALGIHAVEARHASKIRYMRRVNGFVPGLKSYITGGNDSGTPKADGNYGGAIPESNTNQAGVVITTLQGVGGNISTNAATEAFDEPLTAQEVLDLVKPFGVS